MQVTDLNNEVTNVVVGNKKSSEFGISTDATFFNLLSTGLYSKPAEAVARETMCNAWDAHIEAGITDIPIAYSKREVVAAKEKGSINVLDNAKNILYDIMNSFMEEYRETASEILFYHQEMTQEEYNFLDEGLVNNLKESPALSYYREENYKFNLIYNTLKNFDKDYELPEMSETCKKTWEDYKNMDDEKVNRLAYIVNQLSGVKRGTRKYIIDLIKKEENL